MLRYGTTIKDTTRKEAFFKTWVLMQAKYKGLGYRRRILKRPDQVEISEKDTQVDYMLDDQIIEQEEAREIRESINHLSKIDQEIFYRKYYLHEPSESIAQSVGISRAAVDNRVWRGKAQLRKFLQGRRGLSEV